jgi:carbon-monoxide dehydrogenase large subunit
MEIADAVSKDGWILGRKMLTLHDSGAYARFSPYGVTKHSFTTPARYTIPNLHFDGYVVFTNRVPTTAMRGSASPRSRSRPRRTSAASPRCWAWIPSSCG